MSKTSEQKESHVLETPQHSSELFGPEPSDGNQENTDLYDCLGVSTSATTAEIVAAYRACAREVADFPTSHPKYKLIKKAYDVLSEETSRRKYDKATKPDLYQVLGVGRGATLREIIVAFRKLARVNHPDKGGEQRAFDLIKEAYRVLSDPDKRCEYDRNGFTWEDLEKPCVRVETFKGKGRGVVATREIGMGEVLLGRERPFAAVLSEDEGAYKSYCHNCLSSLATRRTKEKCGTCGAHYCAKPACGLHCEQHERECLFVQEWRNSDLFIYQAAERPSDKVLFLLHAVFNGGLVFEHEAPLVPLKSTPLQVHVSELSDNAGKVEKGAAELNLEYASFMGQFLESQQGSSSSPAAATSSSSSSSNMGSRERVRELLKLLRIYDTNALPVKDDLRSRSIAKGLYLSLSLFNHSCVPNCSVSFEGDAATVRTNQLVPKGQELCLAYVDCALPREVRQAQLFKHWRFHCDCRKCASSEALERERLVHGIYCPIQDCRCSLEPPNPPRPPPSGPLPTQTSSSPASTLRDGGTTSGEEEGEEKSGGDGKKKTMTDSTTVSNHQFGAPNGGGGGGGSSSSSTTTTTTSLVKNLKLNDDNDQQQQQQQPQLQDQDLRPNALAITSVPYVDQSFQPSMAGYLGEREGWGYREGRHGPGYYQEEDEYGYAVPKRGDDIGLHRCSGCNRSGADVFMQQALVLTAERHKFFYTHKQPALDPRIAAFETAEQLRMVANLELSCLHPFHPSVAETLRVVYRMHMVLQQYGKAIQVLRVLAVRDELCYGVVAAQTAHTSWLLADALLRRSTETPTTAPLPPSSSSSGEHPPSLAASDTEEAHSYKDASDAADWAQKALQVMAVLYGRNHELTYATHVTLDMAHFRMEWHVENNKRREQAQQLEMVAAEEAVVAAGSSTEEEEKVGGGGCEKARAEKEAASVAAVSKTTMPAADGTAPSTAPSTTAATQRPAKVLNLQCPTCATMTALPAGTRLIACSNCGHFCTALHECAEVNPENESGGALFADPFGAVMSGILKECHDALPLLHQPGDMLPTAPLPFSTAGLAPLRASTCGTDLYDTNLRSAVLKIAQAHREEWHPCDVCSAPRAAKRCSGCKVVRYCSLGCATEDYGSRGHKEMCKMVFQRHARQVSAEKNSAGNGLFGGQLGI